MEGRRREPESTLTEVRGITIEPLDRGCIQTEQHTATKELGRLVMSEQRQDNWVSEGDALVVRSLGVFLSELSLAACGARLGSVVAGLFGQQRQCGLRGKVGIGQVIIPCISITHFLY